MTNMANMALEALALWVLDGICESVTVRLNASSVLSTVPAVRVGVATVAVAADHTKHTTT